MIVHMCIAWCVAVPIARAAVGEQDCQQEGAHSDAACQETKMAAGRMLLMSQKGLGKRHVYFEEKTKDLQRKTKNLERKRSHEAAKKWPLAAADALTDWLCPLLEDKRKLKWLCKAVGKIVDTTIDVDNLMPHCKSTLLTCAVDRSLECVQEWQICVANEIFHWEHRELKHELKNALAAPLDVAANVSALAALAAEDVYQDGHNTDTSLTTLAKETIESTQLLGQSKDTVALYKSTSLDATCFLAFSGTNDMVDWTSNANAKNDGTFCGETKYHHGFAEEITRIIENQKFDEIKQHWTECDRLYVVGHSLGGALASMVAECINCNDEKCHDQQQILAYPTKDVRLITFGAPAYATQASSSILKGVRFWNKGDVVPFLSGWFDEDKSDDHEQDIEDFSSAYAAWLNISKVLRPNTEFQHPRVMAVGMNRMNLWSYNIQDADDSILNFENSGDSTPLLSRTPMYMTLCHSLVGAISDSRQMEKKDLWAHRMTDYRSRLQNGLEVSPTTMNITCFNSKPARPLGDLTIVTNVADCLDHAKDYKHMAFGCPQNDGFECWRGDSINGGAQVLDRMECEGHLMTDIGNGISNGHCAGYPEGTYTVTYKGLDLPLGGWHREPVMEVVWMKALI